MRWRRGIPLSITHLHRLEFLWYLPWVVPNVALDQSELQLIARCQTHGRDACAATYIARQRARQKKAY